MLQAATANWNPSAEGYSRAMTDAQFERDMAAVQASIAVSASESVQLVEQASPTQMASYTTQPSMKTPTSQGAEAQGLYGTDTAMLAVAMIGGWMMIVGGAMLSRRFKLVQQSSSAAQHQ